MLMKYFYKKQQKQNCRNTAERMFDLNKNRITDIIGTVLLAIALTITAFAYSGNGTSQDPYIIESYEDFCNISVEINNGDTSLAASHIKLNASIDFSDKDFLPIGTAENPFTGVFDGNGYSLNDIYYSAIAASSGVFAYAQNAIIKNLSVVDAEFILDNNSNENAYCGMICGSFVKTDTNDSVDMENCYTSGIITVTILSGNGYAGGIAGKITSTVTGADITAKNFRTDCDITVKANEAYCGGFAGYAGAQKGSTNMEISCLYTSGMLNATSSNSNAYCGGMIGYLKAEESGWGEWMSEGDYVVLSEDSYALSCSISLCEISAKSSSGKVYTSYTVSQTEGGPVASKLYCIKTDSTTGGISGKKVSATAVKSSSYMSGTVGFDMKNVWTMNGGLNLIRKNTLCGTVLSDEKTVHVRVNGYMPGNVFIVAYDTDGRIIKAKIHTVTDADSDISTDLSVIPAKISVFAFKNTISPICESKDIK